MSDTRVLPDYQGGSIVNLLATILSALDSGTDLYPPLESFDSDVIKNARNIVLLMVDGLGYEYLNRVGAGSTLQQHITRRLTTVFPSTTATAITSYLTGLAPQQHGLTGWFMYYKEMASVMAVLPFRVRAKQEDSGSENITPRVLYDHQSIFDRIHYQTYTVYPARIVNSVFSVSLCGRAQRKAYNTLDEFFHTIKTIVRGDTERKFVFAYYPEIDALAHMYGIDSEQTAEQLSQFDDMFTRFCKTIDGSDTTVLVTADHGFIDCPASHWILLDDHPELARLLALPLCGEPRVAYCYVEHDHAEAFQQYVQAELSQYAVLRKSEDLIEQHYFGLGTAHPRLVDRIGQYTLLMRHNYSIKDWLPGEKRHSMIGVHGGLSEAEMYVPLAVWQL